MPALINQCACWGASWLLAKALFLSLPSVALAQETTVLNDDGAWSWFEDERAIVVNDQILVGSVAHGSTDPKRKGHIEVVSYHAGSGKIIRSVLHEGLQSDDHDSPALWRRSGDGRILAMYAKHGNDNRIYYRLTARPDDIGEWEREKVFVPSERSRVTYSNLHWLGQEQNERGRLYNFFRGYEASFKPSWMYSEDEGESWRMGGLLIDFPDRVLQRPYVKYASDARNTAHFFFTEGHPRNYDNSVYHAFLRHGVMHRSDGSAIQPLKNGPIQPRVATRIFQGDPDNVAWTHDIALDTSGRPRVVYSVQKDSADLPAGNGGRDHRYRYAVWTGQSWSDREIAFAGRRLYAGEDDYTGGICLDPHNPDTVYLSSPVHPVTDKPLPSGHYEIWRGTATPRENEPWQWRAVTHHSSSDNFRPIVPQGQIQNRSILLWLRGQYRSYTDYDLEVVMQPQPQSRL